MGLEPSTADITLQNLLTAWPLSRIKTMTIEEFSDLDGKNATIDPRFLLLIDPE